MRGKASSKRAIKLIAIIALATLVAVSTALAARAWDGITRSEETNEVFNAAATPHPELLDSVVWRSDPSDLKRQMEPLTRVEITSSWLRAWEQLSIVAETGDTTGLEVYFGNSALAGLLTSVDSREGLPVRQLSHILSLEFYAQNGQLVSLTADEVRLVRAVDFDGEQGWKETVESYDVILLLENGTWRIQHWVRRSYEERWWTDPVAAAAGPVDGDGEKTEDDEPADLALNGINYYPRDHPFDAFWANYDPQVIDDDLDRVVAAGLDSVRIFLPFDELGGRWTTEEDLAPVKDFLDRAAARQLGVVVTLFDGRTDHRSTKWASDRAHLETVVTTLGNHEALVMWDLKNEPDRDIGKNGVEEQFLYAWLGHIARATRDLDGDTPLTVGWSTPEAALAAPVHTDVVSFHYYRDPGDLGSWIDALHEHGEGRPVMLTEFGLATYNSVFPGGHTEKQQAAYVADVLTEASTAGIDGTMLWTLWDLVESTPDAGSMPWRAGPQRSYGLLRADGSPKPAHAVVDPATDLDAVPGAGPFAFLGLTMWRVAIVGALGTVVSTLTARASRRRWRNRRQRRATVERPDSEAPEED